MPGSDYGEEPSLTGDDSALKVMGGRARVKGKILKGPENYVVWRKHTQRAFRMLGLHKWISPNWRSDLGIKLLTKFEELTSSQLDGCETALYYLSEMVNDEHQHIIDNAIFPWDAWAAIQDTMASGGTTGEFRVLRKLENLCIDTSQNPLPALQTFLTERSKIYSEAACIGVDFVKLTTSQAICFEIMRLLSKLPESFEIFVAMVAKDLDNYGSVGQVESELRLWAEKRWSITGDSTVQALAANRRESKTCTYCKLKGHEAKDCWQDPSNASKRPAGWAPRKAFSATQTSQASSGSDTRRTQSPNPSGSGARHPIFNACSAVIDSDSISEVDSSTSSDGCGENHWIFKSQENDHPYHSSPPLHARSMVPLDMASKSGIKHDVFSNCVAIIPTVDAAYLSKESTPLLLLDSGCSGHIVNLPGMLHKSTGCRTPIEVANGKICYTEEIGDLYVKCGYTDGAEGIVKIAEVRQASWASKNLLSVGTFLNERGMTISGEKHRVSLLQKNAEILRGIGHGNNLFKIKYTKIMPPGTIDPNMAYTAAAASSPGTALTPKREPILMHLSLGHAGYTTMYKMAQAGLFKFTAEDL